MRKLVPLDRYTLSEAAVSSRTVVTFVTRNSVLEINYVTNVTTVLDETAASDRVSRYKRKTYTHTGPVYTPHMEEIGL